MNPRPTWRDYALAFVLTVGGIILTTIYLAPILAGGIPAFTDYIRGTQ